MKKSATFLLIASFAIQGYSCDYSVNGEEKVVERKNTLDLSTPYVLTMVKVDDWQNPILDTGYFFEHEKDKVKAAADKKCSEIQAQLAENGEILAQTFSCESTVILNPVRYTRTRYGSPCQASSNSCTPENEKIYTYKIAYSYKEHIPELTTNEIKLEQVKKLDACIKSETVSDEIMSLINKKIELLDYLDNSSIAINDSSLPKKVSHQHQKGSVKSSDVMKQ